MIVEIQFFWLALRRKMNTKYQNVELNEKEVEKLNVKMVLRLFKILYNQNQITKKEYESLVTNVHRTFNFEK